MPTHRACEILWDLAWAGKVSSDTFQSIRHSVSLSFRPAPQSPGEPRLHRRWKKTTSAHHPRGNWFLFPDFSSQALEQEEENLEKARLVLDRYGVVFREILTDEIPELCWKILFRALPRLELSGEAITGRFFLGVKGLQFASPQAWHRLSSTLFFYQGELFAVSRKAGKSLQFNCQPGDERIKACTGFFNALRQSPPSHLKVREINREPALESPFRKDLISLGFETEYRELILRQIAMPRHSGETT